MKKTELIVMINQLMIDSEFKKVFEKEINQLIDSGYLDIESYDFKEHGYQLPKLCLYLVLRSLSQGYKPIDTAFIREYKHLLKEYGE